MGPPRVARIEPAPASSASKTPARVDRGVGVPLVVGREDRRALDAEHPRQGAQVTARVEVAAAGAEVVDLDRLDDVGADAGALGELVDAETQAFAGRGELRARSPGSSTRRSATSSPIRSGSSTSGAACSSPQTWVSSSKTSSSSARDLVAHLGAGAPRRCRGPGRGSALATSSLPGRSRVVLRRSSLGSSPSSRALEAARRPRLIRWAIGRSRVRDPTRQGRAGASSPTCLDGLDRRRPPADPRRSPATVSSTSLRRRRRWSRRPGCGRRRARAAQPSGRDRRRPRACPDRAGRPAASGAAAG